MDDREFVRSWLFGDLALSLADDGGQDISQVDPVPALVIVKLHTLRPGKVSSDYRVHSVPPALEQQRGLRRRRVKS